MIPFRNIFTTLMYVHPILLLTNFKDIFTSGKLNCTEAGKIKYNNSPQIRVSYFESPNLTSSEGQLRDFPGVIPTALSYLELECKFTSPVTWNFQQYPYIAWDTDTERKVSLNSSKDEFISKLMLYSFRIFDLEHRFPTCYSIGNKCLQTTLASITKSAKPYETAQLHFQEGLGLPIKPKLFLSDNRNCTVKLGYDERSETFFCHTTTGEIPELLFKSCSNPVTCNSLIIPTNCSIEPEISIDDCTEEKACRIASVMVDYLPAVVTCVSSGKDMNSAYIPYFYSLPIKNNSKAKNFRYFNWNDAPPEDMLEISVMQSSIIYTGQPFNISCNASYYYFSSGLKIRTDGAHLAKVDKIAKLHVDKVVKIPSSKKGYRLPLNRSVLLEETIWEAGKYQITCSAPVWNSTDWISKSQRITVLPSVEPTILGGNKTFFVDYMPNMTVICRASGIPKPVISWFWNTTQIISDLPMHYRVSYGGNGSYSWAKLHFPNLEADILENVTCVAKNFIGNDTKDFHLIYSDSDEMDPLTFVVIIVSVTSVVVVVGLVWKIVSGKNFNILTKEEWKTFMEGRMDYVETSFMNSEKKTACAYVNDVIEYLPYDKSLEIGRDILLIDRGTVLGIGAYGVVWKAELKDTFRNRVGSYRKIFEADGSSSSLPRSESNSVAVKALRKDNPFDGKHFKALLSELKILSYIGNHKHIVNLIGASTKNLLKGKIYIVLELCENGNLLEYIKSNRKFYSTSESEYHCCLLSESKSKNYNNLEFLDSEICITLTKSQTFTKLMTWALQITDAMEYLASKKIVHGDLALRNILLSKNWEVKITDFGLSNKLNEYKSYSPTAAIPLPYKWLAFECLQSFKCYLESDIWSFGITLWEILSLGETPYSGMEMTPQKFLKVLQTGERPPQPALATPQIYDVLKSCWHEERQYRPKFTWLKYFISECLSLQSQLGEPKQFPKCEKDVHLPESAVDSVEDGDLPCFYIEMKSDSCNTNNYASSINEIDDDYMAQIAVNCSNQLQEQN